MTKQIIYAVLLLFLTSSIAGQGIARVESIEIQSKALSQEREILIYTPIDYDWRVNECFNVIYVFDSQNREFFDYTSSIISFLTDNSKSFIVVGITSPNSEKLDYSRNNDMLPVLETEQSINRFGKYSGNADAFYNYIHSEVIPYIDSHYRTLNNRTAVGHSLSASFILYSFIKNADLFNNYIAISPNLAYDNNKLAHQLINYNYASIQKPTYLYLSNANEGVDYWQAWKPARDQVYAFYEQTMDHKNVKIHVKEFPEYNHWSTFPPSLNEAFTYFFNEIDDLQAAQLASEEHEVTIKVKVLHKKDNIYITGNQDHLGNWNPKEIKMNKVSDLEREIKLKLKSPAQFKFTRGNWESEAEVTGTYGNIIIKPELQSEFNYEVEGYIDEY